MRPFYTFLFSGLMIAAGLSAQAGKDVLNTEPNVSPKDSIVFSAPAASGYILRLLQSDSLFRSSGDTLRISIERLINQYNEPFDSIASRLMGYPYDSLQPERVSMVSRDTLPLKWLDSKQFIIDTLPLKKEPTITRTTIVTRVADTLMPSSPDSILLFPPFVDSLAKEQHAWAEIGRDTINEVLIDTAYLRSMHIRIHRLVNGDIVPPVLPAGEKRASAFLPDSAHLVITDTITTYMARKGTPFYRVPGPGMPDSLRSAVGTLLAYTGNRDSILLYLEDIHGRKTPFWLTAGKSDQIRYWLKNFANDSITVWMGNPSKHELTMILEEDVDVKRLEKVIPEMRIITREPKLSLLEVQPLKDIPVYWNYEFSSAFLMNQTYLSHWAKGGENSLSTGLDIKGAANYVDKAAKIRWINTGRLQYASILSQENGLRTNTDMTELNSQYNKVLKDNLSFSALFYFKTQIARGYNYPNDSVVISKFLNPGTFTIGMGVEYAPFKKTTINFSALSYKNTFVLDTASIDQTAHGIEADRKSKQEIGGQLLIKNELSLLDDLNIANTLRLFSNYHDHPENVDVDWEINLDKRINWYFSIVVNLHLIYDDDIRFPVMNANDQPVTLPDGSIKKSPKIQLREFLGLSFQFRF